MLLGVLVSLSTATSFAQGTSSQQSDAIAIQGTVRNSAGEPVAGVSVILEEKERTSPAATRTNADGAFTFSLGHPGIYTLRAQKPGFRIAVTDPLALSAGEQKHVNVTLEIFDAANRLSSGTAASPSPGAMELEDKPHFTIAGVTDWTAAGGHGSDTNLRTSEELAKETLALKSDVAEDSISRQKTTASGIKDPVQAVREYEQATRLNPSEQNYFDWGSNLLLHRAVEPAVEVFRKGSAAHPKSARMLSGLGAALYANGAYEEAAQRVCAASDLTPADPTPYLFLGKMESAAPHTLPCVEQKMARFVRDQPGVALANYYYAMTLWKRQKKGSENVSIMQEVQALLEKAFSIDPRFDRAHLQLGILQFERGDLEQAVGSYKKASELNPNLAEAHYRLGVAYKRLGQDAAAEQEFQTHQRLEKTEAAAIDSQRREVKQFLFTLSTQPKASQPR